MLAETLSGMHAERRVFVQYSESTVRSRLRYMVARCTKHRCKPLHTNERLKGTAHAQHTQLTSV
jgi:hypothetical protein